MAMIGDSVHRASTAERLVLRPAARPRRHLIRRGIGRALLYGILIGASVIFLLPLAWMISASLSTLQALFVWPPQWIPHPIEWRNYLAIFNALPFGRFFVNTCVITGGAMIGQVFSSAIVAYGFARLRAPGKNVLFVIVLATLMLPSEVTLVPTFILFKWLGWIDTFAPLIVPNFFANAFNIFLLRQLFSTIPIEIDEAAHLDGLGYVGIFARMMLPLSKPGLATVAIFTFTANWSAFLGPLIYLNSVSNYPLGLGVLLLSQTSSAGATPQWNLVMAASMLLTIPMLLIFFFGQRYFLAGITISGKRAAA
jgi:multiple sugar transport system permease protein